MQPIVINGNIVTMTIWLPQLRREKPLYLEIADAIRQDLTRGTLRPGDRLPPPTIRSSTSKVTATP